MGGKSQSSWVGFFRQKHEAQKKPFLGELGFARLMVCRAENAGWGKNAAGWTDGWMPARHTQNSAPCNATCRTTSKEARKPPGRGWGWLQICRRAYETVPSVHRHMRRAESSGRWGGQQRYVSAAHRGQVDATFGGRGSCAEPQPEGGTNPLSFDLALTIVLGQHWLRAGMVWPEISPFKLEPPAVTPTQEFVHSEIDHKCQEMINFF